MKIQVLYLSFIENVLLMLNLIKCSLLANFFGILRICLEKSGTAGAKTGNFIDWWEEKAEKAENIPAKIPPGNGVPLPYKYLPILPSFTSSPKLILTNSQKKPRNFKEKRFSFQASLCFSLSPLRFFSFFQVCDLLIWHTFLFFLNNIYWHAWHIDPFIDIGFFSHFLVGFLVLFCLIMCDL